METGKWVWCSEPMLKYHWEWGSGWCGTMAVWNVSHAMGQILLKLLFLPVEKSVELHECILTKHVSLNLLTYWHYFKITQWIIEYFPASHCLQVKWVGQSIMVEVRMTLWSYMEECYFYEVLRNQNLPLHTLTHRHRISVTHPQNQQM